jgi:uncharacterized protein YutD
MNELRYVYVLYEYDYVSYDYSYVKIKFRQE